MRFANFVVLSAALFLATCLPAQTPLVHQTRPIQIPGENIDADVALDRALKKSSLTYEGKPFHAVLDIDAPGSPFAGRVEVWWVSPAKYKSVITSAAFKQTRIVNGSQVQETDQGDYYPRWLEDFKDALLDPIPMLAKLRGTRKTVTIGPPGFQSCFERDDRPGGITDQMTWGQVCFNSPDAELASVIALNYYVKFADWNDFGKKHIARTYSTEVLDHRRISARITTLEALKHPDEAVFVVSTPTPADQQILTGLVSTLKEESMVEKAAQIEWPTVREGKTDGYMIVYARTDRTGQVRETVEYDSDQAAVESAGMQQALRFKFKPLVVDGVPMQMEMPLVLHFTTKLGPDAVPILSVDAMKQQIVSCGARLADSGTPPEKILPLRLSINAQGRVVGVNFTSKTDRGIVSITATVQGCRFAPLVRNGAATFYKGDLNFINP